MRRRLAPNGLALLITFHSIERDRVMSKLKESKGVFEKVVIEEPSKEELGENSMSRSARLVSFRRRL